MKRKRRDWICLLSFATALLLSLYLLIYIYVDRTSRCFNHCDWRPGHGFDSILVPTPFTSIVDANLKFSKPKTAMPDRKEYCQPIDIAIVCVGYSAIKRVLPLIKNLLFFRRRVLHFHFVINDNMTQHIVSTLFDSWNLPAVKYSTYDASSVMDQIDWIPNKHYSGVNGLLKLTLPYILPSNLDRVLVLDYDLLFNANPEDLILHWDRFDEHAIVGLVENQSPWYLNTSSPPSSGQWPALGRGFNTGVILMHLSRMRRLNWLRLWQMVVNQTMPTCGPLRLADQDVFNAVIEQDPKLVYRLACEWNVQLGDRTVLDLCPVLALDVKIVHFNTYSKSSLKNRLSEYFNQKLNAFVELSPVIADQKVLQCHQSVSSISDMPQNNKSLLGDDFCAEYLKAVDYRIHLYYTGFNYEPAAYDVTLVTQLSFERLHFVEPLLTRWRGPASIAVYLTDSESISFETFVSESTILRSRPNLAFHLVFKRGQFYPVNKLRNVALKEALTKFVFLIDADFLPSDYLYDELQRVIAEHNGSIGKRALVVPAFELVAYLNKTPSVKSDVLTLFRSGYLRTFKNNVWIQGHRATDYDRWFNATADYQTIWTTDYEPYVVLQQTVPLFDERFIGYGWNKVSHSMELNAAGYEFIVMHNAFLVHIPHSPSLDVTRFRSNPLYRRCLRLFKGEFVKGLLQKYAPSPPAIRQV